MLLDHPPRALLRVGTAKQHHLLPKASFKIFFADFSEVMCINLCPRPAVQACMEDVWAPPAQQSSTECQVHDQTVWGALKPLRKSTVKCFEHGNTSSGPQGLH